MMTFREQLLHLIAEAQKIHREEKSLTMRSLRVIGELELRRAAPSCGMSVEKFARHIALTKDQYLKRSAASRTLRFIPEAKLLLEAGEISLSHLALISAKITRANRKVVLENIRGKSLREAKLFMSRVTPDGELLPEEEICELKLTLTKSQFALLERAREVLAAAGSVPTDAEIFMKAVGDLLTKRDPLRKAERAAARQRNLDDDLGSRNNNVEKTVENNDAAVAAPKEGPTIAATRQQQNIAGRYIPAAVRHQVWLRDQGQCTHMHPDGSRCQEKMMIELDHINLYCRGGEHSASNLQVKCRLHNNFAAAAAFGNEWYRHKLESVTHGRDS
jgi:5-methylcytosine-specific restriction endonuclease McrA